MNDYFPDNFVDYDDPPLGSDDISSDNRDFSLTSPNSDSTGLFPLSSFSPQVQTTFPLTEQLNFDLLNYYPQQQEQTEVPAQNEVPESSKKGSRSKKAPKAAATPAYTENSTDSASEGKILDKSKRIQKREIAKERTKQKTDLATMFQGVDSKFLPEGYDDPNLDERTKKKMIQMVRNRISAQNSRDRKKGYMSSLEEQNNKLEEELAQVKEERDALARELQAAQEEIQYLRNGGSVSCQNCQPQVKDEDFLVTNHGENNEQENIPPGGFSGLSSPRLVRFASSKGSLFGMFAFTALVAMVAFSSVGEQNMGVMSGNGLTQMTHTRMLDIQPSSVLTENLKARMDMVNVSLPDYSQSLMVRNINQIMAQFEKSYEPTFKAHLEKSNLLNVTVHEKKLQPIVKEEIKNGIVEYQAPKVHKLRKNLPQVANTPPALSSMINGDSLTSTLFCSAGTEFYDTGSQNVHLDEKKNLPRNVSLDIEKAEYLQLLVPKGTIKRHNVNNKLTDIYGQDILLDDQSDDTMLEIWCKVFVVRELGTSY